MIKKISNRNESRLIKISRWLFSLVVFLLLFYLTEEKALEDVQPGAPPVLYSNVCHDNLEKLFVEGIQSAERDILLIIYSLNDAKLIQALNAQAAKGIVVKVVHDTSTPSTGFQKLSSKIDIQGVKRSGLMHQKILVVDHEKVWIGSANMTTESLKLHDNLVVGLINKRLAHAIEVHKSHIQLNIGGQKVEYWEFPQKAKEGLARLIQLIDEAQISVRVAMFTWTHTDLTDAIKRAHQRGLKVEVVIDSGQAKGVCQKTVNALKRAKIDLHLSSGLGLLHHKFAWIDEKILVNGSANWTLSAFSRNCDCFLILHSLTPSQNEKMHTLWKRTKRGFQAKEEWDRIGAYENRSFWLWQNGEDGRAGGSWRGLFDRGAFMCGCLHRFLPRIFRSRACPVGCPT